MSRSVDYPQRVRAAAPTNITFDNLTIAGTGTSLVYFYSGVTNSRLVNSELKGFPGDGVAIYLDAESAYNIIKNNTIHADTNRREQLAIDGSAGNLIIGNYFSALDHGGIYVYRNCGENGAVRHTEPSHNRIVNNTFFYDRYTEAQAASGRNTQPGCLSRVS
jgi:hypothetical protein